MELLADENIEAEWVQALCDDGHDLVRVVDVEELGLSATDPTVLARATQRNRVLLTVDQSDFSDPLADNHPSIIRSIQLRTKLSTVVNLISLRHEWTSAWTH
jgi:predicted nuclease of predicted toxin-antitoxin system